MVVQGETRERQRIWDLARKEIGRLRDQKICGKEKEARSKKFSVGRKNYLSEVLEDL